MTGLTQVTWGLLGGLVFFSLDGTIKATTSETTNEAEYVKGFAIPGSKGLGKQWAASRPVTGRWPEGSAPGEPGMAPSWVWKGDPALLGDPFRTGQSVPIAPGNNRGRMEPSSQVGRPNLGSRSGGR